MSANNSLWVVLGGLLVDSNFRGRLRGKVATSGFPALDLQRELRLFGFPLGVSDLAHVALLLGPRWSEVEPAIAAFDKTADLVRLPNESETCAAIGLLVPDTDYREGLLKASDKADFLANDSLSPGFPSASLSLIEQFLANDDLETKLHALEQTMWHSTAKLSQARCDPRYNIPKDDTILIQSAVLLEEFAAQHFDGQPSTDELVSALREVGITENGGLLVLRPPRDEPSE